MTEEHELAASDERDYRSLMRWVIGVGSAITAIVAAAVIIGGFAAYTRLSVMSQQIETMNATIVELKNTVKTGTGVNEAKLEKVQDRLREEERTNDAQAIEIASLKERLDKLEP